MSDYSKTIIYKIQHVDNIELIYVGHTTAYNARKSKHKTCSINDEKKIYKMIRDNGGWDQFEMKPIMEFPCENRTQASIQEEKCRIELRATMNSIGCIFNLEKHKENRKAYKTKNRELLNEKNREYYQEHKDERKVYRESIREEQIEYKKKWYAENKAKINELRYQKYKCDCGCEITKTNKSQHEKTKTHQAYIDSVV